MEQLYDTSIFFGQKAGLPGYQVVDPDKVSKMLDKYKITKALITSLISYHYEFNQGNKLTFEAAKTDSRLIPCPAVVPNPDHELEQEKVTIAELVKNGARCVYMLPKTYFFSNHKLIIDHLMTAISEFRLPVKIPRTNIDFMALADLAKEYPDIPFIYADVTRDNYRNIVPVLKQVKNFYIQIGTPFAMNQGLDFITKNCGSKQMLFSTNYPLCEPGTSVSYLHYSKLSPEDFENIAWKNLERLISEVKNG